MLNDVAFIQRGAKARAKIFKSLEKPSTPTELAKRLEKHRSSVNEILAILVKNGYAKTLTEKKRKYTLYALTPKGIKTLKQIKKIENKK